MQEIRTARFELTSAHVFLAAFVAACAVAAVLIGSFPLQMSIATIFLFAGVHNFMEFRYFAARMPLRWGRSRLFYSVGIGGVVVLAAAYLTLYFASGNWLWSLDSWATLTATWNTAFVLWLGLLFFLRGKQRPKSDWAWAFPGCVSARGTGVARAAILEPFARLHTSVYRDVVSRTADPPDKTRMAAGLSLLPRVDPGLSCGFVALARRPAKSVGGNKSLLADHAARRQPDIAGRFEPSARRDACLSRIDPLFRLDIADTACRLASGAVEAQTASRCCRINEAFQSS